MSDSDSISESTRTNLFRSIAAVETAAPAIIAGLTACLAKPEGEPAPFPRADAVAARLMDMLLEQSRHMIEGRGPQDVGKIAAANRALGIDGRHYSRFGDALIPVLKDVLGPRLPGAVASAWCDAFWSVIRRVLREGEPQAVQLSGADDREPRRREVALARR